MYTGVQIERMPININKVEEEEEDDDDDDDNNDKGDQTNLTNHVQRRKSSIANVNFCPPQDIIYAGNTMTSSVTFKVCNSILNMSLWSGCC